MEQKETEAQKTDVVDHTEKAPVNTFKNMANRKVVLFIAVGFLAFAFIYMCTIPLPTGFYKMDFFNFIS